MNWSKIEKKTLKILGFLVIDILIIILLIFALFYLFQDEIKNEVLTYINQNQNGEIEIKNIDLTLIKYFPLISLQLGEVKYREGKWGDDSIHDSIIGEINNIDISLNIIDLIQGDINVKKLTLEEGRANLIVYPDSSINLINAIGDKSSDEDSTTSDLILSNVTITDLNITYHNSIGDHNANLILNQFSSNFALSQEIISCNLKSDGLIKKISLGNNIEIDDWEIETELDFNYDLDSLQGDLNESKIEIEDLIVLADGKFGYEHDHLAELNLKLSDENVEQLYRVLSDNILEDKKNLITQGSWYGNGIIIWDSFDRLPVIDFKFGFNDLNVILPQDTTLSLYLDFDGLFNTGITSDLSGMKFELTDIEVRMPGGTASGSFYLNNWKKPIFELQLNADLNLTGYENIFNIQELDSLKGRLLASSNLS